MYKDPVCGMTVAPNRAAGKSEHQGSTYYFCALGCKRKFDQNPDQYLNTSTHKCGCKIESSQSSGT